MAARLLPVELGIGAQAARQHVAEAGLVGAAVGGRDRVAVGIDEAVAAEPGDGPFHRAVAGLLVALAGEDFARHLEIVAERGAEIILQPAREMERCLGRRRILVLDQQRIAAPADFDAAEQIGLRPRHAVEPRRLEGRALAENVGIGVEADLGAATVVHLAERLQLALRDAARKTLAVELAAARHLDLKQIGQRVDHRNADAVQAAGGFIDLGVEFAARMQRRHDDFERRLVLEFRVRIDRDAAAIVGDGQEAVGGELDVDEGGMAGHRLVHRIVDHLGKQMVQRLLVGAADIHAGPAAHRLQALQHLDVAGVVAFAAILDGGGALDRLDQRIGRPRRAARRRGRRLVQSAEEIVAVIHASSLLTSHANRLPYCHVFPVKGQGVPVPFTPIPSPPLVGAPCLRRLSA